MRSSGLARNKAVQRSACSGLSALLEEAQHALTPRLGVIVQHLVAALGMVRCLAACILK
jgi:hypothetical protein